MSPAGRLCWLAFAALALACGEDEPPPEPSGPPPAASLETVDLCGASRDTAAFVREKLVEGGASAVVGWFRQNVSLPANVRTCRAVQSEPQEHPRVLRIEIARMTPQGAEVGNLLSLGEPLATLPLGVVAEAITVYPDERSRRDVEGVRVTISSFPE